MTVYTNDNARNRDYYLFSVVDANDKRYRFVISVNTKTGEIVKFPESLINGEWIRNNPIQGTADANWVTETVYGALPLSVGYLDFNPSFPPPRPHLIPLP